MFLSRKNLVEKLSGKIEMTNDELKDADAFYVEISTILLWSVLNKY